MSSICHAQTENMSKISNKKEGSLRKYSNDPIIDKKHYNEGKTYISNMIFAHRALKTPMMKCVYGLILTWTNYEDGKKQLSLSHIVNVLQAKKDTILKAIGQLEEVGAICVKRTTKDGTKQPNEYLAVEGFLESGRIYSESPKITVVQEMDQGSGLGQKVWSKKGTRVVQERDQGSPKNGHNKITSKLTFKNTHSVCESLSKNQGNGIGNASKNPLDFPYRNLILQWNKVTLDKRYDEDSGMALTEVNKRVIKILEKGFTEGQISKVIKEYCGTLDGNTHHEYTLLQLLDGIIYGKSQLVAFAFNKNISSIETEEGNALKNGAKYHYDRFNSEYGPFHRDAESLVIKAANLTCEYDCVRDTYENFKRIQKEKSAVTAREYKSDHAVSLLEAEDLTKQIKSLLKQAKEFNGAASIAGQAK